MNPIKLARTQVSPDLHESVEHSLEKISKAHEIVETGISNYFFDSSGELQITHQQVYEWVADRAIDEYLIGQQAGECLFAHGPNLSVDIRRLLAKQVADEFRHHKLLYDVVGPEHKANIDARLGQEIVRRIALPRWRSLVSSQCGDNPNLAVLEVTLIHEGFANAAIKSACRLPLDNIAGVYQVIARDELAHFSVGLNFSLSLLNTEADVIAFDELADDVLKRSHGCCQYGW